MTTSEPRGAPMRTPRFPEVIVRPGVRVPMRDGVTLDTDLYLPAVGGLAADRPVPALLARTPYRGGKEMGNSAEAMRLARHGYMVVWQHVRGRFASDGEFTPFVQEAEDGYDAIEWVAAQPHCDGRVGTFGPSYLAWAQAAAATEHPPHLAAMSMTYGYPHGYYSAHQGGALDVFFLSYFVRLAAEGKEADRDPAVRTALEGMRFEDWLSRLPLREGQSPLALAPSYERAYFAFVRHDCLDVFWRQPGFSPADYLERWPDVPTLWRCGWFDHYSYAHPDTLAFSRLRQRGHQEQYVLFGPWTHDLSGREGGQASFGSAAPVDACFPDVELRWFDRCLKGVDDDGLFSARVHYFTMGGGAGSKTPEGLLTHGGTWQEAATWPPEAPLLRWHLRAGGALTTEQPVEEHAATTYRSDPDHPVPSSTGVCYTVSRAGRRINPNGAWGQVEGPHLYGCTAPYMPLCARADVLVFQTPPLAEDLEVTGHPVVELWMASDAPDTDLVAKLVDVYPPTADYPNGITLGVAEGILRAKFRDGYAQPALLEPGRVYAVRVELRPLSNLFKRGHRLRLDLCSSSWPHIDVNTQTGTNPSLDRDRRVARNTIYHESARPSSLLLPVVRQHA